MILSILKEIGHSPDLFISLHRKSCRSPRSALGDSEAPFSFRKFHIDSYVIHVYHFFLFMYFRIFSFPRIFGKFFSDPLAFYPVPPSSPPLLLLHFEVWTLLENPHGFVWKILFPSRGNAFSHHIFNYSLSLNFCLLPLHLGNLQVQASLSSSAISYSASPVRKSLPERPKSPGSDSLHLRFFVL